MMQRLAWFSVAIATCAVLGCGSGTNSSTGPSGDPIALTFESTPGSFASFGWTGAVHNVVQAVGTSFGTRVTECSAGVCRFEGPTDPPGSAINRRRCLARMSKTCTADADCPLAGTAATPCVYIYDTPQATGLTGASATSGPQIGACGWSYIPLAAADGKPTIAGTLNLTSGALNLESLTILLPLNSKGDGTFWGACAECVGDPKANDGVKGGTCRVATHLGDGSSTATAVADPDTADIGMPCDVNRTGTTLGYEGSYSMDCAPTAAGNLPPLVFGGSFTSGGFQISITDQSPPCTTPGERCFCGMCPDARTACTSNADCGGKLCTAPTEVDCDPNPIPPNAAFNPSLQINQCKKLSTDPTKFLVAGDECDATGCIWDNDRAIGHCASKLPGGRTLGCYPSKLKASIVASGRAVVEQHLGTTYFADTAGARCIPSGQSPQLNSQLGLPGLLLQKRNFQITPVFAEDSP
ncbi:MAG TPA: hypothetical protein VK607_15475 [Kofleriaceae bacterium]|nr:hypothetical protein [Kofleriaceae bacterium]